MVEDDMREIAEIVSTALSDDFDAQKDSLGDRSRVLMDRHPLYSHLASIAA
jgi:hypothetical protein